jgi:hypothetical protein
MHASGVLKLHILNANLHNKVGGPLHKMSPFVHIKVGSMVWNSPVCEKGGKEPRWMMAFMEIPVGMFQQNMHIVIKDQGHPLQPIGEANVPLAVFTQQGPREERI